MGITVQGNLIVKGDQLNDNAVKIVNKHNRKEEKTTEGIEYADYQEVTDIHEQVETNDFILNELRSIFFGKVDVAYRFLEEIKGLKPVDVVATVKKYLTNKEISELSAHRDLWKILHNNGYYTPSESNWNQRLNEHF